MRRLPTWWLAVAVAVGLGIVVLAVALATGSDPTTTADPSPTTPVSPTRSSPSPTRVSVPDLVGMHPREARSVLRDAGPEMLVHRVPGRHCNITRRVFEQSEPSGRRQPVQVWVRVNALTCRFTPTLREVAERFIDFARRDVDAVPADTPVDLYVGGRIATAIETRQLDDPDAWRPLLRIFRADRFNICSVGSAPTARSRSPAGTPAPIPSRSPSSSTTSPRSSPPTSPGPSRSARR